MKIRIKISPPYSIALKKEQLEFVVGKDSLKVHQLVAELIKTYPQLAENFGANNSKTITPYILVNGSLANQDSIIVDGDVVRLLYPLTGG